MKRYWSLYATWLIVLPGVSLLANGQDRGSEPPTTDQLTVIVRETAGIRRFGYPVRTVVSLSKSLAKARHFQLLEKGKAVAAQFQTRPEQLLDLDFNVSLGPYEKREYVIERGESGDSSPSGGGIHIDQGAEGWSIRHERDLEFVVPKHLSGLLRHVRTPDLEYLRAESAGLLIRSNDNTKLRVGGNGPGRAPAIGRVIKPGPLAGKLRFESMQALSGGRNVSSIVELEFPVSKSWVEVRWVIDDAKGDVAGLGADLNLNLLGEPTLVDFGAGTSVYAQLRKGELAKLRAGSLESKRSQTFSPWQVLTGPARALTPYVAAARGSSPAEGWAHIMDRERCTAVAVEGFADLGQEADITVAADGRLQIWKHFARGNSPAPSGPKKLTFWLHFVPMPVHVGAATSPQAMLAPLAVEIRRQKK